MKKSLIALTVALSVLTAAGAGVEPEELGEQADRIEERPNSEAARNYTSGFTEDTWTKPKIESVLRSDGDREGDNSSPTPDKPEDRGNEEDEDSSDDDSDSSSETHSSYSNEKLLVVNVEKSSVNYSGDIAVTGYSDEARNISVFLGDEKLGKMPEREGWFRGSFPANTLGNHTLKILSDEFKERFNVEVKPTLRSSPIELPENLSADQTVPVCTELTTQKTADIRYHHNGELIAEKTAEDRVCVDTEIDEGRNSFRFEISAGGLNTQESETVEAEPAENSRTAVDVDQSPEIQPGPLETLEAQATQMLQKIESVLPDTGELL